ncbi:penicillin acylase family protein [Streptomyces odontomachi]|uniref:penicillin acylase family protein n=1 Tax=Streptomyces odontomachi TaxID=2944940 RepID=UPI002108A9CE|nr:penicillin acylase family protein [Streptomyces sp. ODS25]
MPSTTTASSGHTPGTSGRKRGRRLRLLVIVLVLALLAGVGYGAYWSVSTVRASMPQTTGTITLQGLSGPVDVKRDAYGIPQIYASSDADLFMAQGYVQAQDRFWEMDVRRHTTSGRLSEMFGKSQVKTDEYLRTLGWHRVAQEEYDSKLSPETKKYLQAYSKGVNAYLAGKDGADISVEYAALGFTNDYKPGKWTPVDSVAWLKAIAWDLRGNMQEEIDRSLMTSRLTTSQIRDLYPDYPYDLHKPIVQEGSYNAATKTYDGGGTSGGTQSTGGRTSTTAGTGLAGDTPAPDDMQSQLVAVSKMLDGIPASVGVNGQGIGSNSWVVSGAHTITGKPLLANDPHLAPQLPSIWYQMGLHCRTVSANCHFDVAGYTFSGMPGVIIGHNQSVAWGMTNLGADVTDLYLEKLSGDGYQYGDETRPFKTRKETIKVAGGSDETITVRETDNPIPGAGAGARDRCPLLSDRDDELVKVGKRATVDTAAPDRSDGYGVALCWTALTPGKSMDAVFALDKAQDWQEFRTALTDFEVPSQNMVYADTKGNIGYQAPGRIPERPKGYDGSLPAPGWDPDFRWTGYIPQSALPNEYNPKSGYIVTANQAVIDQKKYPYVLTKDPGYGTRSQRIDDLIQSKIKNGGKISPDDMRQMQMDNSSEIARLLTPKLLKIDISDPSVREAQKLLEGWDYTQNPDSAAAAYFNAVWRNILKLAFGNKLPKELRVKGQCLMVQPANKTAPVDGDDLVRECGQREADQAQPDGGDRWFEVVRKLLDDEGNDWWHLPKTRTEPASTSRDKLFKRALEDARWELTAKLGKDIDTWSWGRLHRLTLKNQTLGTSGPGPIQYLLNRGPYNIGGGSSAVDATSWDAAGGYQAVWTPSMRMVVNLKDLDKSKWINLTGASGHAFSPHYTDQTDKWLNGDLLTWSYSKKAVDGSTEDTLVLRP